jgi:hypothetical protein
MIELNILNTLNKKFYEVSNFTFLFYNLTIFKKDVRIMSDKNKNNGTLCNLLFLDQ